MTLRIRNRHIQTVCAVLLLSTVLLGSSCTLLFPGEYRNFWSLNYAESRAYQVRARHVAEGQHISLWLERSESVSPYDLSMILDEFDEAIHPRLSGSFGSPGDIDGNGKVIVLLMDIIDNYGSGNDTYIAGMFLQKDIQPGLFSNQGEMLYLDIYPGLNYSGALDVLLSTAAHEYLHLLDFSAGNYRDLWLAESLATAAEYLYEQGQPEYRTDLFAQGAGTARISAAFPGGITSSAGIRRPWRRITPLPTYSYSGLPLLQTAATPCSPPSSIPARQTPPVFGTSWMPTADSRDLRI
jgi:hypothetical protein